jgi:hypothetical protein
MDRVNCQQKGKPGLKDNDLHAQAIKRAAKMTRKYGQNLDEIHRAESEQAEGSQSG